MFNVEFFKKVFMIKPMIHKSGTLSKMFLCITGVMFCCFSLSCSYKEEGRSALWYAKNSHLIPSQTELKNIFSLDQDKDGVENGEDKDIDGDGVKNTRDNDIDGDGIKNILDPSPYDWREIGYQPFGMLAFLSWRHNWNNFKYDEKGLLKVVKLIKESGCAYVRMDFYWSDIEPSKGDFDFNKYDFIVELLSKNNIRILAALHYSADWASSSWNSPPIHNKDFTNYCEQVVRRYENRIKYWEIWNEPDSLTYWQPQDGMKRYSQLLKESYIAIKEVDPSCKIVLGGLTSGGYYALKNLYREGAGNYFDIVNIHPFVNPLQEGAINQIKILHKNIRKLMNQYGDADKKIWFTEMGCPGVKKSSKENNWWEGISPDESQQSVFVKSIYEELIDLESVEKNFWAFFRDNKEHFNSGVDYFGLIRWDYSPKASFYAYKKAFLIWKRTQVVSQ